MVSIYPPIGNGQEQPTGDDSGSVNQEQPVKPQLSELHEYLLREIAARHEADQKLRDDPDLRIAMVEMMPQIGQIMYDAAKRLAKRKENNSLFDVDYWGDLIAWQLGEFLGCGLVEYGESRLTQLCQIDQAHAADWFLVGVKEDGTLTPFKIEKSEVVLEP